MKKKLNKNHKGLAMAMAVGFAAMAAPMTAQAEETSATPEETEKPVPASTEEEQTLTDTPSTDSEGTPPSGDEGNSPATPSADGEGNQSTTPPADGEGNPSTTPPAGNEGNPSATSLADGEGNPSTGDNTTPIENPETLEDAKHNVDLAEKDVKDKENALKEKEAEEERLLEEQKDTKDKKDSADGTMTELEGEVEKSQTAVNNAKNDLKEWEAALNNNKVTTDLKDAEADLKAETAKFPAEGGSGSGDEGGDGSGDEGTGGSTTPTQDAVANAQTDLENARKEAEDAQKAYDAPGEQGDKDIEAALNAKNTAKEALDNAEAELAEKQKGVDSAQTELNTAQNALSSSLESVPASADSSEDDPNLTAPEKAMKALGDVKAELKALLEKQKALNGALETQAAIEDALKSLDEIETGLDSLNMVQIKDYEDSLKALSEAEKALYNAENALTNSKKAFDDAATALSSLSTSQEELEKACDALNNITQEDLEADSDKLDNLKADLDTAYADDTTNKEKYEKAVQAIDDMNVPTADLLGDTLKKEQKEALLNTLKSAVATNLESQKADAEAAFAKAQRKIANSASNLITAANKMLTELNETSEPETPTRDGNPVETTLSEVETTLSDVKSSVKTALSRLIAIAQTTDGVKQNDEEDAEVSPSAITVDKAQSALTSLAEDLKDGNSLAVKTTVTDAKDTLTTKEDNLGIRGMQDTVNTSRTGLTSAMKGLANAKTALDNATGGGSSDAEDPSELIETVQKNYGVMVGAETKLETAKTALSTAKDDLDKAESNYIEKVRAYDKALNERTWLQQELYNANAKLDAANTKRNDLLGVDSEEHAYVQSRNAWRTACDNLGELQQNIIKAKNELAQKKQDLTVAIAKKEITDQIAANTLVGEDAINAETERTVTDLISTLGIKEDEKETFRANFKNHITNYHTAFTDYNNAVVRLEELKGEIATAETAKKDAAADLKIAQNNLLIAEAVRDSFLPKPVTPSQGGTSDQTVREPIPVSIEDLIALRAAVYDSQAGDLPSYTDTAESNDTQWTSAEYTYAGFVDEIEKGILSISPMKKRTSPNLELSLENSTFNIVTKTWMSFDKKVINALSTRPDLSINLKFLYKGKWYRVLIPAGYDLKSLLNKDGYCGFLYLYKLFGINGQTAASR